MLKKFSFLIAFLFLVSLISCSKKTVERTDHSDSLYDFSYTLASRNFNAKNDFSRYDLYYFPSCLKRFLFSEHTHDGKTLMLIEIFHPDKAGLLESSEIYCPACDDGEWLDELLILVEEMRIADELSVLDDVENEASLEDLTDNFSAENDSLFDSSDDTELSDSQKNADSPDDNPEKYFSSGNEFTSMEFEKEIFIPQQAGGEKVLVHSSKGSVSRSFYDDFMRLTKIEYWNIKSFSDSKLLKSELYEFSSEEARTPSKKTVLRDNSKQDFFYDSESRCQKQMEYSIAEDGTETLISTTGWTYNKDGKILVQQTDDYSGETVFTKMRKYVYNSNGLPPESLYYENGVLKLWTTYSAEKDYISKIFFDDDFAVTTYYEGGIRIKDVYTMGKNVLRVKNYE